MRQERMRYEKVLEEAAAQRAKELNRGKVREEENETDGEETEDEGDELVRKRNKRERAHVIRELSHVIRGIFTFSGDFRQKPHVIRGSYTYNVGANTNSSSLLNSNSNPRSFGLKIGRIKRRLIKD
ncbi:hypothetical protein PIB30_055696 [Stylosanthes scabra]|uniref:Uncharacterized protein n=1 Tax=Stylosanthes scabra TaxID=79078 RepID=A0ABU6UIN9_9FABA|nr:hypothetical protein [Stylosanthes scabra]